MGENDASKPETVEEDGTGGPEESGAGYGNNAGYQGGADAGDEGGADAGDEGIDGNAEGGKGAD
ncbi:MAG TPA: hypothetical protein VF638_05350 [Sphingomonas sp.]|jgi:hypothetical protein